MPDYNALRTRWKMKKQSLQKEQQHFSHFSLHTNHLVKSCSNSDCDSVNQGRGLKFSVSHKCASDADSASPQATLLRSKDTEKTLRKSGCRSQSRERLVNKENMSLVFYILCNGRETWACWKMKRTSREGEIKYSDQKMVGLGSRLLAIKE